MHFKRFLSQILTTTFLEKKCVSTLGLVYFISYFYSEIYNTNRFDRANHLESAINKIAKWRFTIKNIRYVPRYFF